MATAKRPRSEAHCRLRVMLGLIMARQPGTHSLIDDHVLKRLSADRKQWSVRRIPLFFNVGDAMCQ